MYEHKCKAYPDGIPDEILEEDSSHVDCKSKDYHFEQNANAPKKAVLLMLNNQIKD